MWYDLDSQSLRSALVTLLFDVCEYREVSCARGSPDPDTTRRFTVDDVCELYDVEVYYEWGVTAHEVKLKS